MELPDGVVQWVRDAVGSDARAVHVHEMAGATTSEVDALDVERVHAPMQHLVLRRYTDPAVLEAEPDPVTREVAVLNALEAVPIMTPRVVAADPHGEVAGVPMLLMTRLHGKPRWKAREGLVDFLDQIALQLPPVHAVAPTDPDFPQFRAYGAGHELDVPAWSRHADAWQRALEMHQSDMPSYDPVLIHRDYHPGNVLWNGQVVSGVVDWVWGCRGPKLVDVAHCRVNLALHIGIEAADMFLTAWETHAAVYGYDPTWDLRDAADVLPDLHESHAALQRLDDFVARAAAAV